MKIEKSKFVPSWYIATQGEDRMAGPSPEEALDKLFELFYWRDGIQKPKKTFIKWLKSKLT